MSLLLYNLKGMFMFKKLIFCLCAISALTIHTVNGAEIRCAPQLKNSLNTIQKLSEARELISNIQKEGQISIALNDNGSEQFNAFWDPERRIIFVNITRESTPGSLIGSILFELHNAYINSKLNHLDQLAMQGRISKRNYVEGVERLEYQNSLATAKLAEKGIALGLFPANARLPTYDTFEEHFRIQKMGGHSAWIANTYDQLTRRASF